MGKYQEPKVCIKCGRKYTPKKSDQKYCGDDCRAEYYEIHYPPPTPVEKVCECGCNEVFMTTMPKKQKYYDEHHRKKAQLDRAYKAQSK